MPDSTEEEALGSLEGARAAIEEARALLRAGFPGPAQRSSYYAMFRASRSLLLLEGLRPKTHHGVFTEFTRRFIATKMLAEELSGDFERAMGTRMKSDYQSGFKVSEEEAEWAVESATAFVEAVADLFARLSDAKERT